jgi:FMN phosphatase YigB (HAD superfamily)
MGKKFELIIFDMDGTLYPSCSEFNKVYPEVCIDVVMELKGIGREEARKEFVEMVDKLSEELGGRATNTLTLLRYYEISFEEFERRVDERIDIEKLLSYEEKVRSVIEKISKNYPIALYTTNNDSCTDRILSHLKLSEFFPHDRRFTISTMGRLPVSRIEQLSYIKPGVNGFKMILDRYHVKPSQTLMVGDSEVSDIEPARKLGMNTYKIMEIESLYRLPRWLEI